jgi:hypothetical protein
MLLTKKSLANGKSTAVVLQVASYIAFILIAGKYSCVYMTCMNIHETVMTKLQSIQPTYSTTSL